MRKLIIALLTPVFYLIPTSSDAVNCANITTQTKCNKTIGCIWDISRCTAKTFLIKYNTGDGCFRMPNSTCTYGATNCTAPNVSSCTYSGYTFRGWSCDSCTTQTLISPGTQLSTLSNGQDIELTAQWQPCPVGHYCSKVSATEKCPAGSTSATGAQSINNCYMQGGETQICDSNNDCFTLPDTVKLYNKCTDCNKNTSKQ